MDAKIKIKNDLKHDSKKLILMNVLRKENLSIAQLLKKTGIKRGTCIYYLRELEAEGLIKRKRIEEGKTGRPTILTFQEEVYKKKREEIEKEHQEREDKTFKEYSENPLTKKIIQLIKENPNIDWKELLNKSEIKNYVLKFQITNWLYQNGFIKESFNMTSKGEKFLKEN